MEPEEVISCSLPLAPLKVERMRNLKNKKIEDDELYELWAGTARRGLRDVPYWDTPARLPTLPLRVAHQERLPAVEDETTRTRVI